MNLQAHLRGRRRVLALAATVLTIIPSLFVMLHESPASAAATVLAGGGQLDSCHSLSSPNGQFVLSMQCDGNLVLIAPGNHPIWASNTSQFAGSILQMQGDGNAVVYGTGHVARWASGTSGHPGSVFAVQDDGNVVIIGPGNHPLWATNTAGAPAAPPPPTSIPVSGSPTWPNPFTVNTNLNRPSGLTADIINRFITHYHPNSQLAHEGNLFIEAEQREGINAQYLVAHAMEESRWGEAPIAPHNYFGYTAYDSCPATCATRFTTDEQGILTVAQFIKQQYLTPSGRYYVAPTLHGMNVHYATDKNWSKNIAAIAQMLSKFR
jgi:Mannosyl-glycoprotein endo-beta-N-acetylglucosaminidase